MNRWGLHKFKTLQEQEKFLKEHWPEHQPHKMNWIGPPEKFVVNVEGEEIEITVRKRRSNCAARIYNVEMREQYQVWGNSSYLSAHHECDKEEAIQDWIDSYNMPLMP